MASPVGHASRSGKGKMQTDVDAPLPASSARDWSELPLDAIASIFGKLGAIEILMGAGLVCRPWLEAASKLPDLWRSVDMARHKVVVDMDVDMDGDVLCAMARVAVDRSGGQLEVFQGKLFVTDELLKYIGDRSPALRAIHLISCNGVSNKGFTELIAKCPMLEHLELLYCYNVRGRDVYEATGTACAQLRRFALLKVRDYFSRKPSGEALGVAAMHELRGLTLAGSDVTNDELVSVLDGCPHLELLDLRGCFNIVVDDALRARCAGINSLVLPNRVALQEEWEEHETLCSRDVDSDYCNSD